MTNFDPGGLLALLTLLPAVVAGAVSVVAAHLADRLGVAAYERAVVAALALLVLAWVAAALVVSTGMLTILLVVLAMVGAYAATRDVTAASYGWVLGVVLLFLAFLVLSELGIYQGVDETGRPQGLLARHLMAFYAGGLFAFGAIGGAIVRGVLDRWPPGERGAAAS